MDKINVRTRPEVPSTLPDTIAGLREEHKSRSTKLHMLGMSLAVGSLFWLQGIQESMDEVRLHASDVAWMLKTAWFCIAVSCVAGAVQLFLDMLLPLRAANLLESAVSKGVDLSSAGSQSYLNRKLDSYLLWGVPTAIHLLALCLMFVFGVWFRIATIHIR